MGYFLGIDSGGSKVEAVLIDGTGRVVKKVRKPGINFQLAQPLYIKRIISRLIKELQKLQKFQSVEVAVIGMAGVFRQEERVKLARLLKSIKRVKKFIIKSDAEIAYFSAFVETSADKPAFKRRPGILIIAGTGSIVLARTQNGKFIRTGGYGFILGDPGSGTWIGREGLFKAISYLEGWGEKTSLAQRMLKKLRLSSPQAIIPKLYRYASPQKFLADFAPLVSQTAKNRDKVALKIVQDAVISLVQMAGALVSRLRKQNLEVKLTGGLFEDKFFLNLTKARLKANFPFVKVTRNLLSSAYGAALLARSSES